MSSVTSSWPGLEHMNLYSRATTTPWSLQGLGRPPGDLGDVDDAGDVAAAVADVDADADLVRGGQVAVFRGHS